MDTNKLSNLLGRLEGYVSNVENSQQDPNALVNKLEALVNRLENVQANEGQVVQKAEAVATKASAPTASAPATAPSGVANPFVSLFMEKCFKNVPALLESTNTDIKNEHLLAGVNLYLDMLKSQEAVLKTMARCKKPSDMSFLSQLPKDNKAALFKLGKPGRAVGTHLRCIEDTVNIFVWPMCSENQKEFLEAFSDFYGAIDFQGEKLTSDGKAENKKWFRAFRTVHQDFYEFIKSQHPKIMKWTGTEDNAQNVYKEFMGSLGKAAPAEAPKAAPKEEAKAAPVKAAPAGKPAKPAPKPPVKVLRFKTWEISNYGAETLVFPAAEVNTGMTFNFFNCEKTKVVIEGKFKNAMMSRCKNVHI
jgi:hypothetical protein